MRIFGRDHSRRSLAHINPRLGRYLLGLPQTSEKPDLTEHNLHYAAFPSLSTRFNR